MLAPTFDEVERKLAYRLRSLSAILGRIYSSKKQDMLSLSSGKERISSWQILVQQRKERKEYKIPGV